MVHSNQNDKPLITKNAQRLLTIALAIPGIGLVILIIVVVVSALT